VRYVVLDLKEGVIKPDLYEPELNAVYAALLAHYRCVADPARVRDPNRKVENAIQHTQATALKGRRFDSLAAQNDFLERWECNWAAKRIHGREKRQVQAMFEEERASLTALPLASFAFFGEMVRPVCDDTTVRVDSSNYAARPAAISRDHIRYLLADEVGLGKTIEAGLVLRELKLRGRVKRILVVAPKGLVRQWQVESRFGLRPARLTPHDQDIDRKAEEPGKHLHLCTAGHRKVGFQRRLKIRSAGWLRFESARTRMLPICSGDAIYRATVAIVAPMAT
jgi:hypothetical protein